LLLLDVPETHSQPHNHSFKAPHNHGDFPEPNILFGISGGSIQILPGEISLQLPAFAFVLAQV